jgi:nucleoside-diphosphate-sugar epimerase
MDSNILGTRNMLALAKRSGAKMLFVSSGEVYGQPLNEGSIAEGDFGFIDLTDIRSCYAESKRAGEVLCVCAAKQWQVDVRIARPFHSYGPGMDLDNDGRVFADFVRNVVKGEPIIMRSSGRAVRCFLYLSDLIDAFFYVLYAGKTAEPYNTAAEVGTSIASLATMLSMQYGIPIEQKNIENSEYIQSKIHISYANVDKLKSLGWKQKRGNYALCYLDPWLAIQQCWRACFAPTVQAITHCRLRRLRYFARQSRMV